MVNTSIGNARTTLQEKLGSKIWFCKYVSLLKVNFFIKRYPIDVLSPSMVESWNLLNDALTKRKKYWEKHYRRKVGGRYLTFLDSYYLKQANDDMQAILLKLSKMVLNLWKFYFSSWHIIFCWFHCNKLRLTLLSIGTTKYRLPLVDLFEIFEANRQILIAEILKMNLTPFLCKRRFFYSNKLYLLLSIR